MPTRIIDQYKQVYCRFCGKECHSLNSLRQHECRCKENPDRYNYQPTPEAIEKARQSHIGSKPWNKGLTKETSTKVKQAASSLHQRYLTGSLVCHQQNKPRTEEEKIKISQGMKNCGKCGGYKQGSGRGHKGMYKGYYCDSTYELVYVIYNLDHNIKFDRYKEHYIYTYENEKHKYYPDFILEDGSLIEIKGYHTPQVDAKISSVTDRKIRVLYEKDLQYAFDYVKQNYTYNLLEDLYDK